MRSLWLGVLGLILIEWLFMLNNPFHRLNVRSGGFIFQKSGLELPSRARARIAPKTPVLLSLACLFCKPFLHFSCYIKAAARASDLA